MDGIFTGIYDAWASRYGHDNNRIQVGGPDDMELFCEYITVEADTQKAESVARSIRSKISEEAFRLVGYSVLSKDRGKADSIYRFLILGFSMGGKVVNYLSNPHVCHVFEMNRNIGFEINHYFGFLRFSELTGGVLFSRVRPANNIIIPLAEHFADRLTGENWLIYDEGRDIAAVHRADSPWVLTDGAEIDRERFEEYTDQELWLQELWQRFINTIGIKERFNKKLQNNMMPIRYREFMREVPYGKK